MSVIHVRDQHDGTSHRQVELKLWHPGCWTLEVTEEFDGTHILEKSLYPTDETVKGDFILVSEGDHDIETLVEAIDAHRVVESTAILKDGGSRARIVVTYQRASSIVPEIVNSEFMPIEPVHITGGYEHWTVLVRSDRLEAVFARMEGEYDITLEAIQEVNPRDNVEFADTSDQIYDSLSTRQTECLFEAHDAGYYNWPREISANDIAENFGISGPTFLEHLRKGEQKVLDAFLTKLAGRNY
ncbi:helix-turn-helix domain-containing protein [Haladaptatus caseinilyticus]|uniref:helix-turn-helix domain-containing protein n=1 Tax=Haladaptatus caseinilyticus TaxID=2993314 RepID=UPI00224B1421|nr:helix-turn-helix domain-containing protein [Haladaptatus caseinilyticus]